MIEKLRFAKPEGDVPEMLCVNCERHAAPKYLLIHPDNENIIIPVCSDQCKEDFDNMPDQWMSLYLLELKEDVRNIQQQSE